MPSITFKDIPDELYERIKRSARTHRRSINSEIIACLERATGSQVIEADAELAEARATRERIADYWATDAEIDAVKRSGRP